MEKALFSWSSGKDSALALYEILNNPQFEIAALLTTLTEDYDRISMHGVRRALLEQQAEALGFPLEKVFITKNASNEEYERNMRQVLSRYQEQGVNCVIFGDIFLEDLRKYREENLDKLGMRAIFPLWKRDTQELMQTLVRSGFRAITTCVDTLALGKEFVGREIDLQFLTELPESVDPCGENGEFHSFVFDGPIFRERIPLKVGEKILREDRFYYCDLIPIQPDSPSANHEIFIREAYQLAVSAIQKGNHPFGALLVKDGKIILTAENTVHTDRDFTRHAELNLVSQAGRYFPPEIIHQCTLYTSTEPCVMCTGAIHWAGISTLVFGCPAESLAEITKDEFVVPCREVLERGKSPIKVIGPLLESEGIEIHKRYW